jgi:hypothetical protein
VPRVYRIYASARARLGGNEGVTAIRVIRIVGEEGGPAHVS